jgi:hypothetical protein
VRDIHFSPSAEALKRHALTEYEMLGGEIGGSTSLITKFVIQILLHDLLISSICGLESPKENFQSNPKRPR